MNQLTKLFFFLVVRRLLRPGNGFLSILLDPRDDGYGNFFAKFVLVRIFKTVVLSAIGDS